MLQDEFVLEQLNQEGLVILQPKAGYRFSLDAVLLARFPVLKKGYKIIDLGTGSGVIPLLLSTREDSLFIQGVEIQHRLAELAKRSVALNKKEDKIVIWEGDLKTLPKDMNGKWDLVVSNPPYFKAGSGKIGEGETAIARHELKCSLEDVINTGQRLLKPKGHFALVHRAERLPETMGFLSQVKLNPWRLKMVHPDRTKNAELFLLEAVKGSMQTLNTLPPLIIFDDSGQYTPEMKKIYAGFNIQEGGKVD